jgi:hypothetical protein
MNFQGRNQSRSSRIALGEDGSMSPEAKLSWMIAAIAVAMYVLIMAWLFTAVEKSGSWSRRAPPHVGNDPPISPAAR